MISRNTGKTILITGGSKGIGNAIKNELLLNGYTCVSPTRNELDISSKDSIKKYFANTSVEFYGLINNAGINILGEIETISDKNINDIISINLTAPLLLIKCVLHSMKKNREGRIINISSIWGVRSKEYRTLYSATKFGINGITKSLARELAPYNILVNSVAPGYVNTEMTRVNVPENIQKSIKAEIPLGRFAEPEEIAKLIVFLLSNENTYITGQTHIIDGGFLA